MNLKVYLIRHGETDWNRQEKLQGHSNIPLNDLGRGQAANLRLMASAFGITHVISSDLNRAHETARLAFPDHETKIVVDPRLREVNLGQAEGLNRHHLETHFGADMIRAWFSTDPADMNRRFPNGESRAEALARIHESILHHAANIQKTTAPTETPVIAFISHGLVIRTLTQTIVGEYRPEFRPPNCAAFEFNYDGTLTFKKIHCLPK